MRSLTVADFLTLNDALLIDVRSPSEYAHAHWPGAVSLPLFSDAERAEIGTLYKQNGKEAAMLHALTFYSPNMKQMIVGLKEELKQRRKQNKAEQRLVVQCWRGGMRSGVACWMLDLFGFEVWQLEKGYKALRRWSLDVPDHALPFAVLGGRTGSGKTRVLQSLAGQGEQMVDLEALAHHRGSAFGGFPLRAQQTQEQFEMDLAVQLHNLRLAERIWVEDESQRIGPINLPPRVWQAMRAATVYYLDVPFELRLQNLVNEYGTIPASALVEATVRIRKKLGGLQMQNVIDHLDKGNVADAFRILLRYYDKAYDEATEKRDPATVIRITTDTLDPNSNAALLRKHLQLCTP